MEGRDKILMECPAFVKGQFVWASVLEEAATAEETQAEEAQDTQNQRQKLGFTRLELYGYTGWRDTQNPSSTTEARQLHARP